MDAATLTYDTLRFGEFEDFPETSEPVWVLGKQSNALTEKDEILSDITSRLWFTYRKNFQAIGGTGPMSDTGWGCMLRCGQMILAEALLRRHLGREWRWVRGQQPKEEYMSILNAFIDRKDSYYSIHQIAQMGVGEGKSIGQWYGPNTVAQVLKKLAVFDTWSRLAVHVAMDNTVIIEEIKRLCMPWLDFERGGCADPLEMNGYMEGACAMALEDTAVWKPLVLLIPLRLGLSDINEAYIETLKQCFMMPQSLGVIGGKPNSAHYFIGFVGEELIYLDPHTTQPAVEPFENGEIQDDSYHCQHPPCRMHICELDPSIAVGHREHGAYPRVHWAQGGQGIGHDPGQGASPSQGTITYTLSHPSIYYGHFRRANLPTMHVFVVPKYPEETPAARGEHANSAHTGP
ncbi:cysteine protease ATG4B isoform X2 [Ictalurus punctatus]|uniref:Cysteine protease n=1 Tax=Ictalurus punctatus TaxID=7998 RepID=A0A9F7TJH4_ICTPU|nr:cysteine protease ATG4B isoform X2 [Ictalurus punctatus]